MLMPFVSVTAIGLIGGLIFAGTRRRDVRGPVAFGVLGAWLGFAAAAIVGVAIDVIARTGVYVAVVGHLGAVAGTAWMLRSERRPVRSG